MKTDRTMKCRMLSVLLACLLAIGVTSPLQAATAKATTMKLEGTSGKVSLKTQNGTARKITKGMRLYNGYTLETAASSYAYISLDSSKAVKLDASSKVTLRQSGKKLELLVKSGKLFFHVKTPLTDKESMNVRTSTMVTGVRGTCGVVEAVSNAESKLYLLEGKVTCQSVNKKTGKKESIEITGGQAVTFLASANTGGETRVEKMSEEDIPLFAIEEVAKDTQLQEKIENLTDLDVNKMTAYLEQQQGGNTQNGDSNKGDDTQNGNSNQGDDTQNGDHKGDSTQDGDSKNDNTNPNGNQPVNPSYPSYSGNPGSSVPGVTPSYPSSPGGSPSTPATPVTPPTPSDPTPDTPPQPPVTPSEPLLVELNGEITAAQVQEAWGKADVVKIVQGGKLNVTAADKLAIEGKKQLQIASGASLAIAQDAKLTVRSQRGMQVEGTVENQGTVVVEAEEQAKTVSVASGALFVGGKLHVIKGEVENQGGAIKLNSLEVLAGKIYNNGIITVVQKEPSDEVSMSHWAYTSGADGVLYSKKKLADGEAGAAFNQNIVLLAEETVDGQEAYYYVATGSARDRAGILNENVALLMGEVKAGANEAEYEFKENALVPAGQSILLEGLLAEFDEHEILVQGKLVLKNIKEIEGKGEAVIRMKGGVLELIGDSGKCIKNDGTGYVIATGERGDGQIRWVDISLKLQSSSVEKTIEGVVKDAPSQDVVYTALNGYLNIEDGAVIKCSAGTNDPQMIFMTMGTNN